jgi:isoleucyl-tRNA synthetase
VEDRIVLALGGDEELLEAIREHEDYVAGEVLAISISFDGATAGQLVEIKGRELRIAVARAGSGTG